MNWGAVAHVPQYRRTPSSEFNCGFEYQTLRQAGREIAAAGTYPLINCKLTINVNTLEDVANVEDRAFMAAFASKISFAVNLFGDVRASSCLLSRQDVGNAKP